uniref:glutamate--tRNA ligase n=1 Tax=Perkinsela sp. SMB-60 TaxID=1840652 RepID=A0A167HCS0_9EUGL|nr:glutamyl-tRNA synthetase [Perkinsela sp. SMB-60]
MSPSFSVDMHMKLRQIQALFGKVFHVRAPAKPSQAPKVSKPTPQAAQPKTDDKYFLKDANKGSVITRFPPEASGFLHIGHAKAALINFILREKYDGKLIFRFDDTNPEKEKEEFEKSIAADLEWLGVSWDIGPTHTSDYFPEMLRLATTMIEKGLAYVDNTPTEEMRKYRETKCATPCRDHSIAENLALWKEMQIGSPEGQKCCLRAKIDFKAANGALRDPTIYRVVVNPPHLRTGSQYKVYPTYDFACPIVDSLEGVTHALRTTEYKDRDKQYQWIAQALGLRCPQLNDYSRLNMEYTVMSKRKLTELVKHNVVLGWDDPRFPTVRALARKGLTAEALRQFVEVQGMSKVVNVMEWSKLWAMNGKILDPVAPRYTAVSENHACVCTIENYEGAVRTEQKLWHKKNPELGEKPLTFCPTIFLESFDVEFLKEGEEVTLMDWGNAFISNIEYNMVDGQPDKARGPVRCSAKLHLEGDFKTTKYKLSWLVRDAPSLPIKCVEFDHLLRVKKFDSGMSTEEFLNSVNTKSMYSQTLIGEMAFSNVQKGQTLQVERRGFYIVDDVHRPADGLPVVTLFAIPDGRAKVNHLSAKALAA